MKTTYILDTSVLMEDPNAILSFHENDVVIPFQVLKELQMAREKSIKWEKSFRTVSGILTDLKKLGDLFKGIELEYGRTIRVDKKTYTEWTSEQQLIALAKELTESETNSVVLVTDDAITRMRSELAGIKSEAYQKVIESIRLENEKREEKREPTLHDFLSLKLPRVIMRRLEKEIKLGTIEGFSCGTDGENFVETICSLDHETEECACLYLMKSSTLSKREAIILAEVLASAYNLPFLVNKFDVEY